jgi:hypothetical protein
MNGNDAGQFEQELRGLKPARPPASFMVRLVATRSGSNTKRELPLRLPSRTEGWRSLLRWLAPATAIAAMALTLLFLRLAEPKRDPEGRSVKASNQPMLRADHVEIDRELVGVYDAIARLPGGEPVRFRCSEWSDGVVFRDRTRGFEIEQRTPRLEVVPLRLEIY